MFRDHSCPLPASHTLTLRPMHCARHCPACSGRTVVSTVPPPSHLYVSDTLFRHHHPLGPPPTSGHLHRRPVSAPLLPAAAPTGGTRPPCVASTALGPDPLPTSYQPLSCAYDGSAILRQHHHPALSGARTACVRQASMQRTGVQGSRFRVSPSAVHLFSAEKAPLKGTTTASSAFRPSAAPTLSPYQRVLRGPMLSGTPVSAGYGCGPPFVVVVPVSAPSALSPVLVQRTNVQVSCRGV